MMKFAMPLCNTSYCTYPIFLRLSLYDIATGRFDFRDWQVQLFIAYQKKKHTCVESVFFIIGLSANIFHLV